MKRLGRWLFNLAAVVSGMLFVASVILSTRSYWVSDTVSAARFRHDNGASGRSLEFFSAAGSLQLRTIHRRIEFGTPNFGIRVPQNSQSVRGTDSPFTMPLFWEALPIEFYPSLIEFNEFYRPSIVREKRFEGLGFGVQFVECNMPRCWFALLELILPTWSIMTALVVFPALRIRRWVRNRTASKVGYCPTFGYDLRVTPDRCPECGVVPDAAVALEDR